MVKSGRFLIPSVAIVCFMVWLAFWISDYRSEPVIHVPDVVGGRPACFYAIPFLHPYKVPELLAVP